MSFADWKYAYLVYKLNPSGTITLDRDIWVSSGRLYLVNDNQAEWINFTSSTLTSGYYILWWVTRNVDPVLVPMTWGTDNKTWLANQKCTLVQPHDTMFDATSGGTIWGAITVPSITVTGATVLWTSFKEPVYANATARDAVITSPSNGMSVYLTAEGYFTDYQSGVWSPRSAGAVTPNATTTTAGKVEMSTDAEFLSSTSIGWTGAFIVPTPNQVIWLLYYGDGSDGDVVISVNTSLTKDMYYNNLTVNTGIILDPAWYAIYVRGTLTLTGTSKIARDWVSASGQTAWTALATGTCWACLWWVTWGSAPWGSAPWVAVNPSYTNITSATGWTGWTGFLSPWTGSNAVWIRWSLYNTIRSIFSIMAILSSPWRALSLPSSIYGWSPSSGWGGGGGAWNGGTYTAWVGWGSGWNWWNIFVYANILAWTWTISAIWGSGWNGSASTWSGWSTAAGWGWGGGWWNGWFITLVYRSWTPFTFTLTGWTGWTGWGWPWAAWANWASWTTGQSVILNI